MTNDMMMEREMDHEEDELTRLPNTSKLRSALSVQNLLDVDDKVSNRQLPKSLHRLWAREDGQSKVNKGWPPFFGGKNLKFGSFTCTCTKKVKIYHLLEHITLK